MAEEHENGANDISKTTHRSIFHPAAIVSLLPTLYGQAKNCGTENKNWYKFACIESFVTWKVICTTDVLFLKIERIHKENDQTFRRTSDRLHSSVAVTNSALHTQSGRTYGGRSKTVHSRSIINWSGLRGNELALRFAPSISQYQYFSFNLKIVEMTKAFSCKHLNLTLVLDMNVPCSIHATQSMRIGSLHQF